MNKIGIWFLAVFTLIIVSFIVIKVTSESTLITKDKISREHLITQYQELAKKKKHFTQNSYYAFRLDKKLKKLRKKLDKNYKTPRADQPDEFVRILNEMRIPYGENQSDYPINYKAAELKKSFLKRNKNAETLPWKERGPGNVAGRVRGLQIDPDDPSGNTWYIGSVSGGIWKTTNAGLDWRNLSPDLPNLAVSTLAMCESNPDIIYAGTGESMFNIDVVNGDGIIKSTDRGETWFQLQSTKNNNDFNNISRIIVNPANPDIVIASTTSGRYKSNIVNKSGIFKSIDGGITWKNVYNETEKSGSFIKKILQILYTPGNFNVQYAAVEKKGILKSTNSGDTWFSSSEGIDDFTGRFEIAVSPVNPNKIFAAAEGNPYSNLYVSSNAGESWNKTSEDKNIEPDWLSAQGWYDNTITAHPENENLVYAGGVYLFQIELLPNNRRKTSQLSTGPVHVDHHNLLIIPGREDSFRILNANDGGVAVSSDKANNWRQPISGLNTTQFYGVDKMPGSSSYIGGMQDNGTYRSGENPDASSHWIAQIGGDGYEVSWHFDNPNKIIGAYQYNGIQVSTDGGRTFSSSLSGLTDFGENNAPFITKIAKTNKDPELLFSLGKQGVWKSTDFGRNWKLTPISSLIWGSISSFHDIRISRANPDIIWAGSRMDPSGKIIVSTDRGSSFNAVSDFDLTTLGGISGLSTHPTEDSTAFVLFSFANKPKILRTSDLGKSWTDISGFENSSISRNGFPDVAVYDLLVFPHTPDTIWAGTEIGLFESVNNGASWHLANNGLPNVCIWQMTHVEDEIVLATHGRGIWSVNIPGMSRNEIYKPIVKKLFQTPDGTLSINFNLRSVYDSSIVFINNKRFQKIGKNRHTSLDTTVNYPVTSFEEVSVQIKSYVNNDELSSIKKITAVYPLNSPQQFYVNDFNNDREDFLGSGFLRRRENGFDDDALHSFHPYNNNSEAVYMLKVPIIVSESKPVISFDEVALIEPGDEGAEYGDYEFWDYAVIEGSNDGFNWIPLTDGYDSRAYPEWLNAFEAKQEGRADLFKKRTINLLDKFQPGDRILIRFRLFADAFKNGWGWAIDNLKIQVDENYRDAPEDFLLAQNYPNPFNPRTNISFQIPKKSNVLLKIFSITGEEVATLIDEELEPDFYNIIFDTNKIGKTLASGVYIYSIKAAVTGSNAETFLEAKKLLLLK